MARTAPVPNIPPIPGMCPSVLVAAGGGDSGGSGGQGAGSGGGGGPGSGGGAADGTGGDGKQAPDPNKYPLCGTKSHPVDVVTGRAFTHAIRDFETAGPLPFAFERSASSTIFARDFGMGPSWGHTLGWQLEIRRSAIWVFTDKGTKIAFPLVEQGDDALGPFGWRLRRDQHGYEVDADDGVFRRFVVTSVDKARLEEVRDRNHNKISLSYDAAGHLQQVTDSAGRHIRVRCDGRGHILAFLVQKSPGEWIKLAEYDYDDRGRLTGATDGDGHAHRYAYNDRGQLTLDENRAGLTFHFRFDEAGRCIESWGDYGDTPDQSLLDGLPRLLHDGVTRCKGVHHCVFEWGPDGHSHITDSTQSSNFFGNEHGLIDKMVEGTSTTTATYRADGHIHSLTDGEGATTTWERDARGRVLRAVDPLERTTFVERDASGLPVRVVDPEKAETLITRDLRGNITSIRNAVGSFTQFEHDERGLVTRAIDAAGGSTWFTYDREGNCVSATLPDGSAWRYDYDFLGRRTGTTDPLGHKTSYSFSTRGDLLAVRDALGHSTVYQYDGEQHLTLIQSPKGHLTRLAWGGYNRLCERVDANGGRVRLGYNVEGELVKILNERGELYRLDYSTSGLLTDEHAFDGRHSRYKHDKAGRPIEIRVGDRSVTQLAYDAAGQLIKRTFDDDRVDAFRYNGRGELVGVVSPDGVETVFERDAVGNVVREVQLAHGVAHEVSVQRDPMGARIGRRTSLGHVEEVERDRNGHRRRTTLDGRPVEQLPDALGKEIRRSLPGGGQLESAFDALGRLSQRRSLTQTSGVAIGRGAPEWVGPQPSGMTTVKSFGYDAEGELIESLDAAQGATTYRYDPVGQLLAMVPEKARAELFRHDPTGNVHGDAAGDAARTYGRGDRLERVGHTVYAWDGDGRLKEKRQYDREPSPRDTPTQVWTYTWNTAGLMSRAESSDGTVVDFLYDAFARRLEKRVGRRGGRGSQVVPARRVRFVWDGDVLVHEIREDGLEKGDPVVEERTYWFEDGSYEPLAHREKRVSADGTESGGWFHYLNDPIGTPERLIDENGEVAAELRRKAWGDLEVVGTARASTPIRLQGQYWDEEIGLSYNRFRYYDPSLARFVARDPSRLTGGLNAQAFVPNPMKWVDPTGLVKGNSPPANGIGSYSGGGGKGGHHIHSQAAFSDDPNYSKYSGLCISQQWMDDNGVDHQAMTNKQRDCYAAMREGKRPNTLAEHDKIALEALKAGGVKDATAAKLVADSKANLATQGVTKGRPWKQ